MSFRIYSYSVLSVGSASCLISLSGENFSCHCCRSGCMSPSSSVVLLPVMSFSLLELTTIHMTYLQLRTGSDKEGKLNITEWIM